jgi:hypothetical protein
MRASVGSPGTEKGTVETPAARRASRRGAARSAEAPVTRRARRPMDAAAAGTWRRDPSPKRMRAAVANSKVGMGKKVLRAKTRRRKERKEKLGKTGDHGRLVTGADGFVGDGRKWFAVFGLGGKMGSFGKHCFAGGLG